MTKTSQRVMGFDPGTARTGYGVVERDETGLRLIGHGLVSTSPDDSQSDRLQSLAGQIKTLLEQYQPTSVAVEKLFFATNTKTAMAVAEARGVILQTCAATGVTVAEYTPLQVKQSVTAYGKATKQQVAIMVTKLLRLSDTPKPDDVTDAIAIALCHEQWRTVS